MVLIPFLRYAELSKLTKVKRSRSPDDSDPSVTPKNKIRALTATFSPACYSAKTGTPKRLLDSQTRGRILQTFGNEVADWKTSKRWEVSVCKTSDPHVPAQGLYMFDLLAKKASNFQRVCREFGARLCSTWWQTNDKDKPPITMNVMNQSQTSFRTWGRVACEMHGKLNSTAVMLEGCKLPPQSRMSCTMLLDLDNLPSYSIFPGQILAVEGTNPTGDKLIVTKMFSSGSAEASASLKTKDDVHLVVASGPFTDSDSLDYEPLFELMRQVAEMEPHVLVLIGPFVPANHNDIQNSNVLDTFEELFEEVIEKIMKYVKGKSTRVVLIPSYRDAHHDPVYPTPEYDIPKSLRTANLHLMPDPCMLDIEGLTIGVTSVDVIRHIGSEEISLNMPGMDRLGRLANHVLAQGCFYPLYPPSNEINVDTTLWEQYAFMYRQPHILVLPSDMRHFCKWTNGCLVINPERLNKHSYARVIVRSSTDETWTNQQVDCEILKI
ncbi:DNA polymerase alpha subunit B isoform X2 [Venturia canescens]|uniref:DNA polymerase alpha subunit B isoform X2 n=1 Tax=Venturia canescens TaxID=32260 RepID=UPI001C9D0B6E|nr:DNA polymerase alpha subunit B isoform X2 [Venturia canescens]